jgi:hypothetical protein
MSDWDRRLIELITDLDGEVWELEKFVEAHRTMLVSRVISDGIAGVFQATDDELFQPGRWMKPEYLPSSEALRLVQLTQFSREHRIVGTGTLDPQLDGTLMFRYAAVDRAAIAEVRSRAGLV